MTNRPKVRLFVPHHFSDEVPVELSQAQSHYLTAVMRLGIGARIEVFNGQDAAWLAEILEPHRKKTVILPKEISTPFYPLADLWLLFAPIKKARTDFIIEKATELGVSRIQPVFTDYTNSERLRLDRLRAHAIEAAEQCGGTAVPDIVEPQKLSHVLDSMDKKRHLFFCDEQRAGDPLATLPAGPAAILVGPEGGFSPGERQALAAQSNVHPLHLGSRILRADTAVVAAITRWMVDAGPWTK